MGELRVKGLCSGRKIECEQRWCFEMRKDSWKRHLRAFSEI
jgi:hypothetical protein